MSCEFPRQQSSDKIEGDRLQLILKRFSEESGLGQSEPVRRRSVCPLA